MAITNLSATHICDYLIRHDSLAARITKVVVQLHSEDKCNTDKDTDGS